MKKLLIILIFIITSTLNAQKDHLNNGIGSWGLDYLKEYVSVYIFDEKVSEQEPLDNVHYLERSVSASGEVKGNINLVRHILPKEKTFNVTDYQFLNFVATNNEPLEIVIMQNENRAWENRLRYSIPANFKEKKYNIAFKDFKDAKGNSVKITDIKTVVFSIIGDYTNYIPFNVVVNNLSFSRQSKLYVDTVSTLAATKLLNYPNPFTGNTTVKLPTNSAFIQIKVFDLLGRVVDNKKISTGTSLNSVKYFSPNLKVGIYKYLLKDDSNKLYSGTFIVK
jgi:hypothetical protein